MNKYDKVAIGIYKEMYKKATPSADFSKLMKQKKTIKDNWFMKYQLDDDKQVEIIAKYCKKHKLDKRETEGMMTDILLGCAPRGG